MGYAPPDRVSWHSGPALRGFLATRPRLEILPSPMAAPDHNPQEQVWEATQRVVSHNHGQRDLTKLAHRFELHLKEHSFASALLDTYDHPRICATYS